MCEFIEVEETGIEYPTVRGDFHIKSQHSENYYIALYLEKGVYRITFGERYCNPVREYFLSREKAEEVYRYYLTYF